MLNPIMLSFSLFSDQHSPDNKSGTWMPPASVPGTWCPKMVSISFNAISWPFTWLWLFWTLPWCCLDASICTSLASTATSSGVWLLINTGRRRDWFHTRAGEGSRSGRRKSSDNPSTPNRRWQGNLSNHLWATGACRAPCSLHNILLQAPLG